eukprot:CAMPEP_0117649414 /NCGR_PEP_ID=MMETSP0804-20121206/959_1 /TAXON_ID=1074897 /ORGANISM="Tetraselmis astigmatica, Strain CCMP880" /LENGTH=78 /DNA_ID=CAMNT_0005455149 /DNA_START=443 /DNA_END=680 /DNA_ORIENTATION=-
MHNECNVAFGLHRSDDLVDDDALNTIQLHQPLCAPPSAAGGNQLHPNVSDATTDSDSTDIAHDHAAAPSAAAAAAASE